MVVNKVNVLMPNWCLHVVREQKIQNLHFLPHFLSMRSTFSRNELMLAVATSPECRVSGAL